MLVSIILTVADDDSSPVAIDSLLSTRDVLDQVDDTAGVAEFVIVPGDELDELWAQLDTSGSIEDGGTVVTDEVRRNNFVFSVSQNALQWAFGSFLQLLLDFIVGGRLAEAGNEKELY